jgi:hypothetical protein
MKSGQDSISLEAEAYETRKNQRTEFYHSGVPNRPIIDAACGTSYDHSIKAFWGGDARTT